MMDELELAMHLTNMPDEEEEYKVWDALYEKYEIGQDEFNQLIGDLLPMIDFGESPLTKKLYKGFAHNRVFFVKMEAN